METVKVIHDREGETLMVWFGDPGSETTGEPTDDGVVVMKDADGRVIGVEVLQFAGQPQGASFEALGRKPSAPAR